MEFRIPSLQHRRVSHLLQPRKRLVAFEGLRSGGGRCRRRVLDHDLRRVGDRDLRFAARGCRDEAGDANPLPGERGLRGIFELCTSRLGNYGGATLLGEGMVEVQICEVGGRTLHVFRAGDRPADGIGLSDVLDGFLSE